MLATVSPSGAHIDETLSTLRYASQARSIINTVRVNEAPQDKLIRELRAEIQRLRELEICHDLPRPLPASPKKKKDDERLQTELKLIQDQLDNKSRDLIKAESRVSAVELEKKDLEAKLTEYIENNRQLASKIASEKNDKQNLLSSKEGETKALVDELVNLREQHKSLKLHYLQSQDELEQERGAKFQIMSEKERDAREIAALKASVEKLENELMMEKNEVALRNSEIKKFKSEISEMKLAQDNLTTTFLLKEEFCNAQAMAESEKEELLASKNKEVHELKEKLETMSALLKRVNDDMLNMKFLKGSKSLCNGAQDDVENVTLSLKKVKEHLEFLDTTNQLLKQQLEHGVEEKGSKDNEIVKLRTNLEQSKENEKMWKRKYEESDSRFSVLQEDKAKLESSVTSSRIEMDKLQRELRAVTDNIDKVKERESSWKQKYKEANASIKDHEKNKNLLLEEKIKLESDSKSLMAEIGSLKKDLHSMNSSLEKTKETERILTRKLEDSELRCGVLLQNNEELLEEKTKLDTLKVSVDNLKKGAEKNDTIWRKKYEEANTLVEDGRQKNDLLQKENEAQALAVKSLEGEVKKLEMKLVEVEKLMGEKLEQVGVKSKKELEEKDRMIADLKKEIQSSQDALRVCRGEKASLDKIVGELKMKIDILESESSVKTTSELESLRMEIESVRDAMSKLNLAEKEIESLKAENAELKKTNDDLKTRLESTNVQKESAKKAEDNQLRAEIQALQERNKYLKKKVRKSKLFSEKSDDSRKLKTEIAQLKRVNLDVVSELEKVRGMGKALGAGGDASNEVNRLRAELEKVEQLKTNIDALLQKAKEEMESAMSEMKVLKSENATLEKRASKAVFENETLREQLTKVEKERADMLDRINHISGEKSVTDYKLRMSLANTKGFEDKEVELKRLQEKNDELKEECGKLRNSLAGLEHQLSLSKLNEETLKGDLSSKANLLESLQNEVQAAQKMQRELMEEKLALVKVLEKNFGDENFEDRKGALSEISSLKKDLRICQQRLDNKSEKMTALNNHFNVMENLLVKVVDDKIRSQLQLEDLKTALVNKDYSAYDMVMGLYLPHHLEYLVRKARVLTENYKIPYDIDLQGDDRTILFKHLILKAVAILNRTLLDKWISKIEEQKGWTKTDDKELPWKVDLESYIAQDETKSVCGIESPAEADAPHSSALVLGVKKKVDGTLDPVEWRRTLIQRHVRGMRDDYRVLIKYFGAEEDSAIYAILERIRAAVDRLEQVTASIVLDSYTK
ncbi:hypothetical protein GE061_013575 [Apolygus lucorum]|uniref:Kinesin motor domain-containing protein n=1 Tax=Apolygus lucorum TaxID=248454 RepID=A0A8S9XPE5_APOLU|nr:hypothetical protein GE061_013575 [Apolygus lucorum]